MRKLIALAVALVATTVVLTSGPGEPTHMVYDDVTWEGTEAAVTAFVLDATIVGLACTGPDVTPTTMPFSGETKAIVDGNPVAETISTKKPVTKQFLNALSRGMQLTLEHAKGTVTMSLVGSARAINTMNCPSMVARNNDKKDVDQTEQRQTLTGSRSDFNVANALLSSYLEKYMICIVLNDSLLGLIERNVDQMNRYVRSRDYERAEKTAISTARQILSNCS